MKKLLFGLLIFVILFGFASCDADSVMKFGNSIGKMGNNVYGIKPDLSQVDQTIDAIKQSISFTEEGTAIIEFGEITDVSYLISEFNTSKLKRKTILEQVKRPIEGSEEQRVEVQKALKGKLAASRAQISEALSSLSEEQVEFNSLLSTLLNCLDQMKNTVSDVPTYADLISVAYVVFFTDSFATDVKKIIEEDCDQEDKLLFGYVFTKAAMMVLDVIDAISEDYDYISRLDVADIVSAFSAKKNEEDSKDFASTISNPQVDVFLQSMLEIIGKDSSGHLSRENFDRFVSTSVVRRALYEIAAYGVSLYDIDDEIFNEDGKIDEGTSFLDLTKFADYTSKDIFTGNDVLSYLVSLIFTDINKLSGCFDNNYVNDNPYTPGYFSLYDFLDAAASKDSEKINNVLNGYKGKPSLIVKSLFVGDQQTNSENLTTGYMAISATVNTAYTLILDCGLNIMIENLLNPVIEKVENYVSMAFFMIELMNSDFSGLDLDEIDEQILEDPINQ